MILMHNNTFNEEHFQIVCCALYMSTMMTLRWTMTKHVCKFVSLYVRNSLAFKHTVHVTHVIHICAYWLYHILQILDKVMQLHDFAWKCLNLLFACNLLTCYFHWPKYILFRLDVALWLRTHWHHHGSLWEADLFLGKQEESRVLESDCFAGKRKSARFTVNSSSDERQEWRE